MAGFFRLLRRIACLLVVACSLAMVSRPAHAGDTYDQAMTKCQAYEATENFDGLSARVYPCASFLYDYHGTPDGTPRYAVEAKHESYINGAWELQSSFDNAFVYDGSPPANCPSSLAYSGAFSGKLAAGSPMCQSQPDGTGCAMTFAPDSPPFLNRTGTHWATHGTYSPTGSGCTPGPIGGEPQGQPAPPQQPPKSCGGGSCYDSANDRYCEVSGAGTQVCVSGGGARGDQGGGNAGKPSGNPPGSCISSGDSTICAGSPSAPTPPAPPQSPISDPPTEIRGSDTYVTSNPVTGGSQTTTVNTYGAGGSQTSSGQGAGDDGPAPSSSTGGSGKGSASGGGDCNTPPICEGDAPTCAVLSQVWLSRCKGDGVQSNDADTTVPGLDGIPEKPGAGFIRDETVLDKLDNTGFGGGTQCPKMPALKIDSLGVDYEADWPAWCGTLAAAGDILMLIAAYVALRMLAEK